MNGATTIVFNRARNKILLIKRRDVPVWVLPGGGMEKGETPIQAAIRETKEESGYVVKIIRQFAEYTRVENGIKNYFFEAEVVSGKATLNHEAGAIGFYKIDQLPHVHHPHIPLWIADLNKQTNKIIKRKITGITMSHVMPYLFKDPYLVFKFILVRMGIHINFL